MNKVQIYFVFMKIFLHADCSALAGQHPRADLVLRGQDRGLPGGVAAPARRAGAGRARARHQRDNLQRGAAQGEAN